MVHAMREQLLMSSDEIYVQPCIAWTDRIWSDGSDEKSHNKSTIINRIRRSSTMLVLAQLLGRLDTGLESRLSTLSQWRPGRVLPHTRCHRPQEIRLPCGGKFCHFVSESGIVGVENYRKLSINARFRELKVDTWDTLSISLDNELPRQHLPNFFRLFDPQMTGKKFWMLKKTSTLSVIRHFRNPT